MESSDRYKLILTIDYTKNYTIHEEYLFFEHKPSNYKNPRIYEGTINDEESARLKQLLVQSNLFKMNDSYGFKEDTDKTINNVIYNINYMADGKEKLISIRLDDSLEFPLPFTQLIEYTDTLINKYKEN